MLRFCLSIIFVCSLVATSVVMSQTTYALDGNAETSTNATLKELGDTTDKDKACSDAGGTIKSGKCVDEDGSTIDTTSVSLAIRNIIGILLYVAGIISVIVIVVSGFRYVTSNGDAAAASRAKNGIVYALIGLVITVMAYAIVNFILSNLS